MYGSRHSVHSPGVAERPEITVRRDERYASRLEAPAARRGAGRFASLALPGIAALLLNAMPAPVRAQVITTTALQDTTCAGTRYGSALGCTAGEFTVGATFTGAPGTPTFCNVGETITLSASLSLSGSNADRYNIGFFVGQTGNAATATGGTCSAAIFPTSPAPFTNFDTSNGTACGDYIAGGVSNPVVQNIKVVCASTAGSDLTIPYVLTYQQNKNQVCTSAANVTSSSGSKCNSGAATLQVNAQPVQVGGWVDVTKQTLPDGDAQSFSYTVTGDPGGKVGYSINGGTVVTNNTSSITFSLTDGQTARVYQSVISTGRTVTIQEQPSGQPSHWQNDANIICNTAVGTPAITTNNATRTIAATLTTTNSGATCTITNTRRAKVTLRKNVAGRLYSNDQFSVGVSGTGSSTLTTTSDASVAANLLAVNTSGTGTGNFTNSTYPSFYATPGQQLTFTDGMFGATTSGISDYSNSLTCTNAFAGSGATTGLPSGSAVTSYNLTPAPGDDITCTYTNTPKAKLTLAKTVINDDGQSATASAWTLSATGPATISGISGAGAVTGVVVPTGTYALSESGPVGYVRTSLVCSGAADTNPADGLTLAAGEIVSCMFTNNDQPVGQTIVKGWALDVDADGSSTVTVGDTLRYTVTVTNTGSIALTNVTITDAKTTPGSKNCASVAPAGTCVLSGTYVVVAGDQTAGSVSNTASVTSNEIPGPVSSNTTTTTVVPPSPAALTVAKSHSGNFSAGTNASYALQVANSGGTAVSGTTTVTDTLATGLTFVSGTGTGWTCGAVGQAVTCTSSASVAAYGSMAPITLTVAVAASAGTSVDNTASVANTTLNGGTPIAGNTDTATIVHADLSMSTKTVVNHGGGASPTDVDAGDVLEYIITLVENAGATATNVHVTDTVQSGLGSATVTLLPAGATDNTSGGVVDVSGITVPANGSVQLRFEVTVGGGFTAGDTIDNIATVDNPAGPDATPGAPTLIYEQSQVVVSGNKILYLHDDQSLDRTPQVPAATSGVTVAASNQQDWVLSPFIPAGETLVLSAGTININLVIATTNTVSLRAQLYDGATLVGSSTLQSFDQAAPASRPFPITLGSDYTLAAGHALTLRLTNSATGSKDAIVYEYNGTGSTISFATTTVVHVDSVQAYAAAYSATTTATYYLHGGTVYVRAVASDPFGGTDVGSADITITDANGSTVAGPVAMTLKATAAASRTFEYALAIPANAALGVWHASVTAHEGTEGTVEHTAIGTFEVRGKVVLQQTWGAGATTGDTLQLQVTGGADAVDGSSTAPSAATPASAIATASLPITLVQAFTVGAPGNYTIGLACTRDADGAAVPVTGSGLSRQIQMPLDSSVTCTWTDEASVPLTIVKLSVVRSDPVNGTTNPKAIPGAIVEYQVIVTNPSANATDVDSVMVLDPLPGQVGLRVADIASPGSGPVQFIDGSPSSGLTYTFTSLGDSLDDIEFYNGAALYTPAPDADGVDANVTSILVKPKGAFNGSNAQFTLKFRVRVK